MALNRNHQSLDALLLPAVIGVLVICGTVTFQNIQQIHKNADLVAQTHEHLSGIDRLDSGIKDAEIGPSVSIIAANSAKNVVRGDTGRLVVDRICKQLTSVQASQYLIPGKRAAASILADSSALLTAMISTMIGLSLIVLVFWIVREIRKKSADESAVLPVVRERLRVTFAGIVDSLGEPVVVLDGDMQVLHVNRAFSRTFSINENQILGRSIYQINERQWDLPVVHELPEVSLGKPDHASHIEIEQKLSHRGHRFVRLKANKIGAGSLLNEAVLLVISDVTEDRIFEERSRRHDQHMRWCPEQIHDYAIFTMDVSYRTTSWNLGVRQVFGFDEHEFVGHDIRKLIFTPEALTAGIPEAELSAAALDRNASDDRWMLRKGGTAFQASLSLSSIRDQNGHVTGYINVIRDLTSTRKAQDELSDLANRLDEHDRLRNELLTTLTHELRNPLAAIGNAVELMGTHNLDPEIDQLRQMMSRQVEQLAQLIVDVHDGDVTQSESIQKRCTIPGRLADFGGTSTESSLPAITADAVSAKSFKVLVVEDTRALRIITGRLLEKPGHTVECVENGPQALLKLDTFKPDVVFSDIGMPGMTGYELARRIRQRPDCSYVCLVAVTGFGQFSDRDNAFEAGFDEHMSKPVDIAVLQMLFEKLTQASDFQFCRKQHDGLP